MGNAHKTDISELMKNFRSMKEAYSRILRTEQESLQLEDILSSLAEEKEEDPKKVEEREKLHKEKIECYIKIANEDGMESKLMHHLAKNVNPHRPNCLYLPRVKKIEFDDNIIVSECLISYY